MIQNCNGGALAESDQTRYRLAAVSWIVASTNYRQLHPDITAIQRKFFGLKTRLDRVECAIKSGCPTNVHYTLDALANEVAGCINTFTRWRKRFDETPFPNYATTADIANDIAGLEREFEAVYIDVEKSTLGVLTKPIKLRDQNFGQFQIFLRCADASMLEYDIQGDGKHNAATNSQVCHPHVNDGGLCAGKGRPAIQCALDSGRIYDFFMLVSQVLNTYSEGAAFIELDDWDAKRCTACDEVIPAGEDYSHCATCSCVLCSECAETCCDCEETYCSSHIGVCASCNCDYCQKCLSVCAKCGSRVCEDCRAVCKECGKKFCEECLDEDDFCAACAEEIKKAKQARVAAAARPRKAPARRAASKTTARTPRAPRRRSKEIEPAAEPDVEIDTCGVVGFLPS